MSLIFVVHNILQVNSCFSKEIFEEFLVENESHPTDLLHFGFRGCIAVDKVGSYSYSKFATKFLPLKTWKWIWRNKGLFLRLALLCYLSNNKNACKLVFNSCKQAISSIIVTSLVWFYLTESGYLGGYFASHQHRQERRIHTPTHDSPLDWLVPSIPLLKNKNIIVNILKSSNLTCICI